MAGKRVGVGCNGNVWELSLEIQHDGEQGHEQRRHEKRERLSRGRGGGIRVNLSVRVNPVGHLNIGWG